MQSVRDVTGDVRAIASGIDHPECVAWYDERVYCGTEGGDLLRIDPSDGSTETVASTDGFLAGIAFDGTGNCVACDVASGRLVAIAPDGSVETMFDTVENRKLTIPNFPAFAGDGTLWVTDSGTGWAEDDGFLFRVRPGREPEIVDDECRRYPNGLALSPGEGHLCVVESRWPGVSRYALEGDVIGRREGWLPLPGTVPDGLAFDADGALYVGCWRPDRVYRRSPAGKLDVYLDDYSGEIMTTPTNLAFGGDAGRTLFLAACGGRTVNAVTMHVPGLPLARPVSRARRAQRRGGRP